MRRKILVVYDPCEFIGLVCGCNEIDRVGETLHALFWEIGLCDDWRGGSGWVHRWDNDVVVVMDGDLPD